MEKQNKLIAVVQSSGLSQEGKVKELMASFTGYFDKAHKLAVGARDIIITDEKQTDLMIEAREKRLKIRRVRIDTENTRKELKEQSLREGRAIDGIANVIKALIVPVEEHLEKQEKYAEIKMAERLAKQYQERIEKLSKYVEDVSLYNLKDMSNDAFERLLKSSMDAFEAQLRAEEKAEQEKLALEKKEAEEQKRIKEENLKLKKEAEESEKKLLIERAKQQSKIEAERKKREAVELKVKKEQEKRDEEKRVATAKAELEAKRIEEEKRKVLLAPDKEKLNKLATDIDNFKLPPVESKEAGDVVNQVASSFEAISKLLRDKARAL